MFHFATHNILKEYVTREIFWPSANSYIVCMGNRKRKFIASTKSPKNIRPIESLLNT